ncbi:MAG: hypothetical protein ACXADL_02510 [Candidatus Thorarchaeota archaeon]|jgi:arginine decarboxylase
MDDWSIDRSKLVYGLDRNDLHFLDVTENGNLCIQLGNERITLDEIIKLVRADNGERKTYTSSFTIRMPQLIASQMEKLKAAFAKTRKELNFAGEFSAVYPVKVNQRSDCVIPVLKADSNYGLEAGTKAELFLIKTVLGKEKHRLIICNGAKDPEYLATIKQFIEEGYKIGVSIESLHEARLIVEMLSAKQTNLVLRIKPYLTVRGHWSHSAGRDSKFGLSIHDLFDVVSLLKEKGYQNCVNTILGHVGSQITAMDDFRKFADFMTMVFYELQDMGLKKLTTIDFGGGLPIDYTSSHPTNLMELYAKSLISGIQDGLEKQSKKRTPPDFLIESGRGITALGSLVIVKALEVRSVFPRNDVDDDRYRKTVEEWRAKLTESSSVNELVETWNDFHSTQAPSLESLTKLKAKEQMIGELRAEMRRQLARLGTSSLRSEKLIESIWHPDHIVIGNFSVFNSIGDHVLVKQHFPIMPVRDLHIRPETTVRLVDITCDSDGEISQFHRKAAGDIWFTRDYRPLTMPNAEMGHGIPVGYLKNVQGSYFVIALTGAYQDVIEMNHNLLGDLPDVELRLEKENEWKITWVSGAQSMDEILEDVGYKGLDIDEDPYMAGDSE